MQIKSAQMNHPVRAVAVGLSLVSTLLGARVVQAECLGLGLPPPEDLNICRTLAEDLIIPPVLRLEPMCNLSGFECLIAPHCCVPGACLAFPECVATEQIVEVAEQVFHAGDLYCGVQELGPEQLMSDLVSRRIPDPVTLSTGGANSILYKHAGAYIDELECKGIDLGRFKDIVRGMMSEPGFPKRATSRTRPFPSSH